MNKNVKHGLRIKVFLFSVLFSIIHNSLFLIHPVYAACDPNDPKFGPCPPGLNEIESVFSNLISVIVGLGFIVMLVMIVMAGFKYLTSGGEPKALQAAHHTLVWAILGIFLMAVAWILLQLLQVFTGIPVTVFNIKTLCVGPNSPLEFCK